VVFHSAVNLAISLCEFLESSKITGGNFSVNRAFNHTKLIVTHIKVLSSNLMMHKGTPDPVLDSLNVFEFIIFGGETTFVSKLHFQASRVL
jgi:hypothetical protein